MRDDEVVLLGEVLVAVAVISVDEEEWVAEAA